MPIPRSLLLPCLLLAPFSGVARADAPPAETKIEPVDQSKWPQKLVVTVGDIRTRVDGPKLWTLSGIDFQNAVVASEDSAYGTVFTIRNVGHLGTAHFLDAPDKPGGVEKEDVRSLRFFVEDKPVTEFKPSMELKGDSFRMERTSNIRGVDLKSSVDIRDGVLIETVHIQANKPMDLQKAHPLMYAWTPGATVYLFGDENGVQKRGAFQKEGTTVAETIKGMRWVAVFNPTTGKGSVCYINKHAKSPEEWFLLVDAPGIYRKVAMYTLVDKIIPEGFDGTYQSVIGFFSTTEQDWEQQALLRLADLKKIVAKADKNLKPADK